MANSSLVKPSGLAIAVIFGLTITTGQASATRYSGNAGLPGHQLAGGNKSGVLKSKAQYRARDSWNNAAKSLMGTSRANWGNAVDKSYYCHHSFVWHCTAYARPCA